MSRNRPAVIIVAAQRTPESELFQRLDRFVVTPIAGEIVRAFVPLPPAPPIDVLALLDRSSLAERAIGRLDGITMLLPLSLRLIREMPERLRQGGPGGSKNSGDFRRSQNWIGGTRPGNALFVPLYVFRVRKAL